MKAARFRETIDEMHKRLVVLTETKGEEYKRREDNQFANFDRSATELGLTREQVLLVFLAKHLNSITTWVRDVAAGQDRQYAEPITGRIDDAILYLLILRGMVEDRGTPVADHHWLIDKEGSSGGADPLAGTHGSRAVYEAEGFKFPPRDSVFVISANQGEALAKCDELGLPRATCALAAVDQLHGVRPGATVIVIHHGSRTDDALLAEVKLRCEKQGLNWKIDAR